MSPFRGTTIRSKNSVYLGTHKSIYCGLGSSGELLCLISTFRKVRFFYPLGHQSITPPRGDVWITLRLLKPFFE